MLSRFFRGAAVATLVATLLPISSAFAARFADVTVSTQYHTAIDALAAKGLIQGQGNGSLFEPLSSINRAEFSKIVASAVSSAETINTCTADTSFSDMPSGIWYAKYVCVLVNLGAISGYPDGTFRGERSITFVEAAKILSIVYGQRGQNTGGEWYEPYANALEESQAIPLSIAALDKPITRADMAEMLWRLTEKKSDQPSKGVLNLKYPELKVNVGRDEIQFATSCEDLKILTEQQQMGYGGGMYYREEMDGAGAPVPAMAMPGNTMNKSTNQTSGDYSQTNVQVEGVDEADVVKTDGRYLYIVRNNDKSRVSIVKATPASILSEVSSIDLTNLGISAQDIYVDGGKLTVIGSSFMNAPEISAKRMGLSMPAHYGGGRSAVSVFDVTNASTPKELRTIKFDGSFLSTRRIGDNLYIVLNSPAVWWGNPVPLLKDAGIPQMEDSKTGITKSMAPCNGVGILPRVPSPQYIAVAVINLRDTAKDVKTEVLLGNADNVYSSLDNLYVTTTRYFYTWDPPNSSSTEKTHIYRFAFTADGIDLQTQGNVPGHVLNQFAMDESGDYFRIATTVSPSWGSDGEDARPVNALYVLDRGLKTVGSIENIAPGETIYSARFMGKRAYLVTFKTVDPFFVVDLSNPRSPKILGQLKIPGFSNYLHPYDDTHVIGFGKDVDESIDADKVHSGDAVYYTAIQGVKLSMFDVTDVANPVEMHKTIIGDRGTETAVLNNHKALLFEKDRNLLALPILVTKRAPNTEKGTDGYPVFQGAYVYDISLSKGFALRGSITHYDDPQVFLKAGSYWYNQGSDVERIVRIDSSLYTISQSGVRAHSLQSISEEGRMNFTK